MSAYVIEYDEGRPSPEGIVDCDRLAFHLDAGDLAEVIEYADGITGRGVAAGSFRILDEVTGDVLAWEQITRDRTGFRWERDDGEPIG